MIKQVLIYDENGKLILEGRYDEEKGIFYQQNRSKDYKVSKEKYQELKKANMEACKEKKLKMVCNIINKNEKWKI